MKFGFNTDNFDASRLKLGYPSVLRIFPQPAVVTVSNSEAFLTGLKAQLEDYNSRAIQLFISVKTDPTQTLNGQLDHFLIKLGNALREVYEKYGFVNYATDHHEPENDIGSTFKSPDHYVEVFDYFYTMVKRAAGEAVQVGPVFMAYQWMDEITSKYKVTSPSSWIPLHYDFVGSDTYSDTWMKGKVTLRQHSGFQKILRTFPHASHFLVERGVKDKEQQEAAVRDDLEYLTTIAAAGVLWWDNVGDAGDWHLTGGGAMLFRTANLQNIY